MPTPVIAVARASRNDDYLESVRRAGAEPLVVDAASGAPPSLWRSISGVLLTGGSDVDPRLYGESPAASHQPASHGRDAFEIELVCRAIEADVPLLAICRGVQVLNVAAGGTLVQHIPTDVPRALNHDVAVPAWAIAHEVLIHHASRLAQALDLAASDGQLRVAVNSRHHQAVKHVAPGLVATGAAEDGVIEALERPGSRFCLGVQWHPENFWRTGEFDRLFLAFVKACSTGSPSLVR